MDTADLTARMIEAGRTLAGEVWAEMERHAVPELRKIAGRIEEIADNVDDRTPEEARALLEREVRAAIGVIAEMTDLMLVAVEAAIAAILDAVRDLVNAAARLPLL